MGLPSHPQPSLPIPTPMDRQILIPERVAIEQGTQQTQSDL